MVVVGHCDGVCGCLFGFGPWGMVSGGVKFPPFLPLPPSLPLSLLSILPFPFSPTPSDSLQPVVQPEPEPEMYTPYVYLVVDRGLGIAINEPSKQPFLVSFDSFLTITFSPLDRWMDR